ncbi:hypothetical protein Vretifemale_11860 [Volvox reticuliferus]|uniref:Uncharacterized protein n=1 Tax=Volvox reticuliferus TaxID=1737510 RepID=A0A8J4CKZ4_9CHLO|nr:hypothetical protein Vretifemale_11860 [Volvox reticuliferus]
MSQNVISSMTCRINLDFIFLAAYPPASYATQLGLSRTAQGTEQPQSRRQGCTISVLRRFVGGSPQLRVLDVSGTQSIEDKRLIDNLAKDVEAGEGGDAVAEARAAAALAENAAMGVAAMRPGRGGRPTGFSKVFPNGPEDIEWRMARLMQSLGPALRPALVGPLRVLRASKSVLATDAGLHAIAVRFGGTLEVRGSGHRACDGWVNRRSFG